MRPTHGRHINRTRRTWRGSPGAGRTLRLGTAALTLGLATLSINISTAQLAGATTDDVTTCAASGAGSLQDVVTAAAAGDTIDFNFTSPCAVITLTSQVNIAKDLTITGPGPGALAVSGAGQVDVFDIISGTVTISGLTIENGGGGAGAGVFTSNSATVTLSNCTLSGNTAADPGDGGGIFNNGGTVNVTDSLLTGNSGTGDITQGGGIFNNAGTMTVTDSTLSDNHVAGGGQGGGVFNNGGTLTVTGSTLSANSAPGGFAGGIFVNGGTTQLTSDTLSGNDATGGSGGALFGNGGALTLASTIVADSDTLGGDCAGAAATDGGDNIDSDGTCGFTTPSVSASTTLNGSLGALKDNGGPTTTIALATLSPAISLTDSATTCALPDQRGVVRPSPVCDSGAFQTPVISTTPNPTTAQLAPTATTLLDSATLSGAYAATGTITFTLHDSATVVDTETATVSGAGSYTTPTGFSATAAGTYQWDASYTGDPDNNAATDNNAPGEQVTLNAADTSLSTRPNPTTVTLGATPKTLSDTAVLSGGASPTGTITFTLHYGAAVLDTESVGVTGNGSYSTPTGYTLPPTAIGTFGWDSSYTGDANNSAATDNGAPGEQVVVSTPCAGGFSFYFLSATARTGSFTGFFCVNVFGTGTYTQAGGAHGTGTITSSGGVSRVTASGTNLALIGQKTTTTSTFTETAPPPAKAGTFTLLSTPPV